MPVVTLTELTKDNWQAVAGLKVAPGQENFVADNLKSIAESQFYPGTVRKVIEADGEIVGFAVYGTTSGSSQMWLHRFMVDAKHQKRGIGRESLRQMIAIWRAITGLTNVKVSYEPDNCGGRSPLCERRLCPGRDCRMGRTSRDSRFHRPLIRETTGASSSI